MTAEPQAPPVLADFIDAQGHRVTAAETRSGLLAVVEVTGKGHLRWLPPRGRAVYTGATPKRYGHGPRNERRALAKAGLGAKGGARGGQ